MSKPEASEPPPAVVLNVSAIVGGVFYGAGTPLPYENENDLLASLKPFIATGEEPSLQPVVRNIYDLSPAARRQVRQLEMQAAHQEFAEQVASEPLPPETAAALQASHNIAIRRARAQLEHNQTVIDAAHAAAQSAEPPQLFVKRGGEWGHVERAKLKVGEHVFVRRENGQMESVGVVNSRGEPPPPEITT
jgi:hypothetical protein